MLFFFLFFRQLLDLFAFHVLACCHGFCNIVLIFFWKPACFRRSRQLHIAFFQLFFYCVSRIIVDSFQISDCCWRNSQNLCNIVTRSRSLFWFEGSVLLCLLQNFFPFCRLRHSVIVRHFSVECVADQKLHSEFCFCHVSVSARNFREFFFAFVYQHFDCFKSSVSRYKPVFFADLSQNKRLLQFPCHMNSRRQFSDLFHAVLVVFRRND